MFESLYSHGIKLWYHIGYRSLIFKYSTVFEGRIEIGRDGLIEFGNDTRVCRWSVYRPWGGYIKVGNNCSINSFCHLSGNGGIEIGNNVRIASHCVIVSANHNFSRTDIPITEQGETRETIIIEDDCWLGAGVKVLAGVTIGHGSVVGAGSVVTHSIPPYSVVVGVPGKVIKSRLQ